MYLRVVLQFLGKYIDHQCRQGDYFATCQLPDTYKIEKMPLTELSELPLGDRFIISRFDG